jgi:hypothetical protein
MRNCLIGPEDEEIFAFIIDHFDATYYLELYHDVAHAGVDPLEHWLNHGVQEGRQISRSVVLRYGKDARNSSGRTWRRHRWRGQDIAVRLIEPMPPEAVSQIVNQARHDATILAAGADVIAKLVPLDRENAHLDVAGLQRAMSRSIEFLLIVPNLSSSGDHGFLTEVVAALRAAGFQSIQTIVVDQEPTESLYASTIPEPLRNTNVVFWQDFWVQGPETLKLVQLAQLIRVLRPRVTIVADSERGYEVVARFGRVLSEHTKIYCAYSGAADSRDFAAHFARRTRLVAIALTDDAIQAAKLRQQYGDLLGQDVALLPRRAPADFARAVATLFGRP